MEDEQIDLLVQLIDSKCYEATSASCAILCSVINAIGSQPGIDIEQLSLSVMAHLREANSIAESPLAKRCTQEMVEIINMSYRAQLGKA